MIEEKVICLGHIISTCPRCKNNDYNKYCERYKPVRLYIVDVLDKKEGIEGVINENY